MLCENVCVSVLEIACVLTLSFVEVAVAICCPWQRSQRVHGYLLGILNSRYTFLPTPFPLCRCRASRLLLACFPFRQIFLQVNL